MKVVFLHVILEPFQRMFGSFRTGVYLFLSGFRLRAVDEAWIGRQIQRLVSANFAPFCISSLCVDPFYHKLFIMVADLSSEAITETDMKQFCVEIMKRLAFQRRRGHLCDVILKVGVGDDQASLKAHKIVLCAASPFFYNAFNSDMKEKKEGVIRLEETSKAVMEEVLEYLYTGHVDINEQNAYDLMGAADYFLLSSLKALSCKVIKQTLILSNCLMAYFFAMKYQCKKLQKGAREFIESNYVAVSETEDFLNLSSKQVEEWISSDEIIVKGEEEVFKVVMRWIQRSEKRKKSFPDLFHHIRFIYVKRDFLFNVILSNPLVKNRS